jgi:hypothetical protein
VDGEVTFTGEIDRDGKIQVDQRELFRTKRLEWRGKRIVLEMRREGSRSSQANRFYWGVVIAAFCDVTGYESDEMHELLAFKFLRLDDDPVTKMPRRKRTPDCHSAEFAEYVDKCQRFGAVELGIEWPEAA